MYTRNGLLRIDSNSICARIGGGVVDLMQVSAAQELFIGEGVVYHVDGLIADRRPDWSVFSEVDLAVDLRRERIQLTADDHYAFARLSIAADIEDELMSLSARDELDEERLELLIEQWLVAHPEHRIYRRGLIESQREWVAEP